MTNRENLLYLLAGKPSNILIPSICSKPEFEAHLNRTFQTLKVKPCRVLLGVSDNVMPEADMATGGKSDPNSRAVSGYRRIR